MSRSAEELRNFALKAINKLYRTDPWVRQLYQAAGLSLEKLDEFLDILLANGFFDTALDSALKVYEKDLGITSSGSLDERRRKVEMLWKTAGKCTLEKIKAVVKTYVLDDIDITFEDGVLKLNFNNSAFVYALPQIREGLEIVKPSHIGMQVADVHETNTELYADIYVTSQSIITINPNIGFNTEIPDSPIIASVYVTKSNVVNNINI